MEMMIIFETTRTTTIRWQMHVLKDVEENNEDGEKLRRRIQYYHH